MGLSTRFPVVPRGAGPCIRATLFLLALTVVLAGAAPEPARAQTYAASMCQAVAQSVPGARFASIAPLPDRPGPRLRAAATGEAASADTVTITFVGHSTFRIETPAGVVIATDYAGYSGGGTPTVVTMNHAHSSHYTDHPDPGIEHVLRGWGTDGEPADHHIMVEDVLIRNVTTDVRRWGSGFEADGNSIFIFEVANLCIGHLGHLHQLLEGDHIALIGRLDVVMIAVDGTYTMSQQAAVDVVDKLRARIVLPMHYFSPARLSQFLSGLPDDFAIDIRSDPTMQVSLDSLPDEPTIIVLPGY
ncbi:MBL fold metallo-hydrolase [Amorphus orientalis]|uniref:L-ascorbate metabolism protein UlaG (Beta-lactamase superfamily) n=1 Tax=Amorphus orientalis TaxID=649198 RepID=A0AAE4ASN0_9HYPH|nr:MBL fold metallo-hydrolase [Amorphus orientalis]MDQ0315282.1 L-ascorbate metabolism protein UlaG (beta-lactamase superfamily) [Amorphus orientalis]